MSARPSDASYDAVATLARSLFGFALVAWLPLAISWILLLLAPAPPIESYVQAQRIIVIGAGVATLLLLVLTVWVYRLDASRSARIAQRLAAVFGRSWLALALALLLVESNILALFLTRGIAPAITGPGRFLLLCWSLVMGGLLLTVNWRNLRATYLRSRHLLLVSSMTLLAASAFALMSFATGWLLADTGLDDRLRGSLDYRPLRFVEDGAAPAAGEFWAEQSRTRVRWLPLSYWAVERTEGQYINVSEQGLRRTTAIAGPPESARVYFFGGSTMWGEGARDAYTIPSQVARKLADQGIPARVQNYGQPAYVSSQDLILFQAQLARGNPPELAVFYHGFNDVLSAYLQGMSGVPYQEGQRASDTEAGRLLRQGQPVLRPPDSRWEHLNWSLIASDGATAQVIFNRWLGNRRLIRALAGEYGLEVLFVWQPALFAKTSLSDFEAQILAKNESDFPGFFDLYREVDGLLRQHALAEPLDDVLLLTDLFSGHTDEIFFDNVHIHELGNRQVAEAIWRPIAERILSR